MTTYVPKAVQEALDAARVDALRQKTRLRVEADGAFFPVLRMWEAGFSVSVNDVPPLRGLVDLFDGARQISQCLIVASEEDAGEIRYEFKRATSVSDRAPVDFYVSPDAPKGLIEAPKR